MKQILLAGALAGIVLFAWSAVSWMALPWRHFVINDLPREAEIVSTLRWRLAQSGVYQFPSAEVNDADTAASNEQSWGEKVREGPVGMLIYDADGMDPANPIYFLRGLALNLIAGMLAASVLAAASPNLAPYWKRAGFVALIGVIASVATHLSAWNWMHHPPEYAAALAADTTIGWILAGLAMAAIITPNRAKTATDQPSEHQAERDQRD